MARTRSEDRLDRAMDVFWQRGYYDTSIEELMSRTGLHRAAVYGSFRSKRGLFEATLRRYQVPPRTHYAKQKKPSRACWRRQHQSSFRRKARTSAAYSTSSPNSTISRRAARITTKSAE